MFVKNVLIEKKEIKMQTTKTNLNRKFLAFCNWSFIKEKHLKEQEALVLFDSFNIEKSPFYVRIFNEMPRSVLEKFVEKNHISNCLYGIIAGSTCTVHHGCIEECGQ